VVIVLMSRRSIAIRAGAWYISPETSLGFHVWRDLPLEYVEPRLLSHFAAIAPHSLTFLPQRIPLFLPHHPPHPPLVVSYLSPAHPASPLPDTTPLPTSQPGQAHRPALPRRALATSYRSAHARRARLGARDAAEGQQEL
jgi:hypothetical protein